VIQTVRPKLSCACCERMVQEPAPSRPIDRDRSTVADRVGGASRAVAPLVEAVKRYVLSGVKVHGDDIPVPYFRGHIFGCTHLTLSRFPSGSLGGKQVPGQQHLDSLIR
jgi:hypothetical protein